MIGVTLWGDFAHQLNEDQFLNDENNPSIVFAAMTVTRFRGIQKNVT